MLKGRQFILLEDEAYFSKTLTRFIESKGGEVMPATCLEEARNLLKSESFDYALFDVNLPDGNSLELLNENLIDPTTGILIMTAEGSIDVVVEALRKGASDYLSKPFDPEELLLVFKRIEEKRNRTRLESHKLKEVSSSTENYFTGQRLASIESELERILANESRLKKNLPPILIEGETGTGKSSLARIIHQRGSRADQALVEINCSTLQENLAESELFGHEKGAFTDAKQAKIGLFEAADGGTLFLDEIASLSPAVQAKLLTAIEDQTIRRVGGQRNIEINTRIIAASLKPLSQLVEEGLFREDLLHRLNLISLKLSPLRDYPEDIESLANFLVNKLRKKYQQKDAKLSKETLNQLKKRPWYGNIRELSHELERAFIFKDPNSPHLEFSHSETNETASNSLLNPSWEMPEGFNIEHALQELNQNLINRVLRQTNQNVSAAARLLGVSRDYIRYRIKE